MAHQGRRALQKRPAQVGGAITAPPNDHIFQMEVLFRGTESNWICKTSDPRRQGDSAAFTKEFNERTKNDVGMIIPVIITVYADRSFTFITKTPPAPVLIKKACNLEKASGVPNKNKVATISKEDVRKIAEIKMPDLNAASIEAAMSMIAGTARSMGILVGE